MELTPINDFDFQKNLKGCGIKYYCKIPRTDLKALLGFCSRKRKKSVEISDESGFLKIFESVAQAARDCKKSICNKVCS